MDFFTSRQKRLRLILFPSRRKHNMILRELGRIAIARMYRNVDESSVR